MHDFFRHRFDGGAAGSTGCILCSQRGVAERGGRNARCSVAKLFHDEKETILSLSPSLANKLIGSAPSELNALEKWLDRINAACKHQCDNLRTMISFEKERMRL